MTIETRPIPTTIEPIGPTRPKTVKEVLLHAALLIEERGWCQGYAMDLDGRYCLFGAIYEVSGGRRHDYDRQAYDAVAAYLRKRYRTWFGNPRYSGVVGYNDTPGRTAAEVVAALREAAVSA